jgi:hypothetical protein
MTLIQYTLDDFTNQRIHGVDYQLPDDIVSLITALSGQLHITEQPETVVAHRRPTKSGSGGPTKVVDNQQWTRTKPFKTTTIEQKTGVEKTLNDIRYCLNNISENNFKKQLQNTLGHIHSIAIDLSSDTIQSIAECIRDSASTNKMNAALYAKLFSDVVRAFPEFAVYPSEFVDTFVHDLTNLVCVSSSENFDLFSAYNKANDKRKGLVCFLVYLLREGLIDKVAIDQALQSLVDLIHAWIDAEDKTSEVDEVTDTIAIFAKMLTDKSATWFDKIKDISKYKAKEHKSLSSRSVFKFMDMTGV